MFLVTGGAGFIGSNIVTSLNEAGASDVVVNDLLSRNGATDDAKWRNLAKRQIADVVPPAEVMGWLQGRKLEAVIHMGAISDTTATDADLVMENNFRTSLRFLDWCTQTRTPFIYASSAATYGDGTQGFDDDWSVEALRQLKPMNLYGTSKHLFDQLVSDRASKGQPLPPHWAGLKFFNVFGPNEYHKGKMASVLCNVFDRARAGETTSATWRLARLRHLPSAPSTSLTAMSVRPASFKAATTFEPINPAPPVTRSIRDLPLIGFGLHLPHSAGTCNLAQERFGR
jgi:ADP-L-glycero-D-manno-heptose 6-epimerase